MKIKKKLPFLLFIILYACMSDGTPTASNTHKGIKEKSKNVYCKLCGKEFKNIKDLSSNSCKKHPQGTYSGKHILYEGSAKTQYECVYCGKAAKTIAELTSNKCKHNPNKGYHIPRH